MTPREAFERVRAHLLAQGRRATPNIGASCMYRLREPGGTVLRCAVGCLVTDAAYDPGMERTTVDMLAPRDGRWVVETVTVHEALLPAAALLAHALNESGVTATPEMRALLDELQCLHDAVAPDRWAAELEALSARVP